MTILLKQIYRICLILVIWIVFLVVILVNSFCFKANNVPAYLTGYEKIYTENPRKAAQAWFKDAKFGLFVHYALASLLPRGKVDFIRRSEAESSTSYGNQKENDVAQQLFEKFTAEKFDADAITDLAVAAGMKYITFTTQHLGRMYMYRTKVSDFTSLNSPAGRDLVAELAQACRERKLGLFLYVPPEVSRTDGELFEQNRTKLTELLTQYGPIAGIWFDGINPFKMNRHLYQRLPELFALIRKLQPQCLISFKEGGLGEEDFVTPEHFQIGVPTTWENPLHQQQWNMREKRWNERCKDMWEKVFHTKLREINTVMQECWNRDAVGAKGGWINDNDARHLTADEVWFWLEKAAESGSNLLMNVGPQGDGSVHPDDVWALKDVGRRIREKGFPGAL